MGASAVLICITLLLALSCRADGADGNVAPPGETAVATTTPQDVSGDPDSAALASGQATPAEGGADWMYHPDSPDMAGSDGLDDFSLATLLLKLGLGLGFVVLLAWGSVFLLKKSPVGRELSSGGSGIRVLERKYLAPKRAVYLVEMGNRTLALGVTDQNITVLSRWRAGEMKVQTGDRDASGSPQTGGFAEQLRSILGHPERASAEAGGGQG